MPGIGRDELVAGIPHASIINASFCHASPEGTYAARRGVPVKDMQTIFGWKTPSMVFRYAKGSEDVQRRAMKGLASSFMDEKAKVLP